MKNIFVTFLILFAAVFSSVTAQVGVGTTAPQGALDILSTTNGVVIPRVSLTSKAAAAPVVNPNGGGIPIDGTLIYNIATAGVAPNNVVEGFYYWDNAMWNAFTGVGSKEWSIDGNAGTVAGTNFLGTTDPQDLRFKTQAANKFNIGNSSGQFSSFTLGTAAAPIYTWNADLNTGIFSPASDILGYSTNGLERMRINAAGQIIVNNTATFTGDRFAVYNTTTSDFAINGYSTLTGTGVYGQNTGLGIGVYGLNNNAGTGVYGANSSTGIATAGVNTGTGAGVYGSTAGNVSAGVFGRADILAGAGVYGTSNGAGANGAEGFTSGIAGSGIYGTATGANGTGVFGFANNTGGDGVYGEATQAGRYGVWGVNNNGTGIGAYGSSTGASGRGVLGTATQATAFGIAASNSNASGTGIVGAGNNQTLTYLTAGSGGAFTGSGTGLVSYARTAATGWGVLAAGNNLGAMTLLPASGGGGSFNGNQWGVFANAAINGSPATDRAAFVGNFNENATARTVYLGATIGGVNYKVLGTGSASVSTTMQTRDGEKILFAPEAPENWFFDIGEATLVNGAAIVTLDPIFVDCISDSKPFKVFVQGAENTLGSIRVTRNQDSKTFTLQDMGGASNGVVQYSIYAIWKQKENLRFPDYVQSFKTAVMPSAEAKNPTTEEKVPLAKLQAKVPKVNPLQTQVTQKSE